MKSAKVQFIGALIIVILLFAGIFYFANPNDQIKKNFYSKNKDLIELDITNLNTHLDFYGNEEEYEDSTEASLDTILNENTLLLTDKLIQAKITTTPKYLLDLKLKLEDSKCPSKIKKECKNISNTISALDPYLQNYKKDYEYFNYALAEIEKLNLKMREIDAEIEIYLDDPKQYDKENYLNLVSILSSEFDQTILKIDSVKTQKVESLNELLKSDLALLKTFYVKSYSDLEPKLSGIKLKSTTLPITREDVIDLYKDFLNQDFAPELSAQKFDIKEIFPPNENREVVNLLNSLNKDLDAIRKEQD